MTDALLLVSSDRIKSQLIQFANKLGFKLLYQGINRWSIHDQSGRRIYPEQGAVSHSEAFDFLYCMARLFDEVAKSDDDGQGKN